MSEPSVYVLTITYNQVDYVREALVSVLEQDYDNLTVVVSDDSSTDGTDEVVEAVAKEYKGRMIAMTKQSHLGMTRNFNRCLAACEGKYLAIQAGDDVYLPGKISSQVAWFEESENRVLCGHDVEEFESATGETLYLHSKVHPLRNGTGAAPLFKGIPYCGIANMIRKDRIPAYGFDERLSFVIDWKLFIDALASGGEFGYVPGVYARRRRHAGNITNWKTLEDRQRRTGDMLTMLSLAMSQYPHLAGHCRQAAATQLSHLATWQMLNEKDIAAARSYYFSAFSMSNGLNWRADAGLLLSLLPQTISRALLKFWMERFRIDKQSPASGIVSAGS